MVVQTERNLQLYESPGSPIKRNTNTHTHTPGRYIYWLGVGWLAIPGNLTIPFFFLLHQQNDVYELSFFDY